MIKQQKHTDWGPTDLPSVSRRLRNKFDFMKKNIGRNIDTLLISETKLDNSFPPAQFNIDGFSNPFRTFWKTFLPHFAQKLSKSEKFNLIEKRNVISNFYLYFKRIF